MNTILVPLDGSAIAERVLPYVGVLAPALGAHVLLLRIVSESEIGFALLDDALAINGSGKPEQPRDLARRAWDLLRLHAEQYLDMQAAPLREAGIDVAIEILGGRAADGIVEAAESAHVAMIAMATHGYGGIKRWALGSVTDKVSHAARAPIFIVRGGDPAPPHVSLKRVIVPLDGSALARQALPLAVELAICTRAELLPLTVITPAIGDAPPAFDLPPTSETMAGMSQQLVNELGHFGPRLQREGIRVTPLVEEGMPADAIIEEAARHRADVIVMATHGYSGLRRWALGSVADKVLHASRTPLLLVRAC